MYLVVETAPARKLKRKPGAGSAILNARPAHQNAFAGMSRAAASLTGTFEWIHVFVGIEAELKQLAQKVVRALAEKNLLWISFPKGSSKIQTDPTRDHGWDSLRKLDPKRVTLISVDEAWSAFGFRPDKPGEARGPAWP